MTLSRSIRLAYMSCSLAWAACLAVVGLWLVVETPAFLLVRPAAIATLGVACIAAANFVFMVSIADRAFPLVARRQVSWVVEVFILAMICTLLVIIGVGL